MTEEQISPFLTATAERNYRVLVEDCNLYVYKEELIAISPIFERMVNSDFAENKQGFIELKEKTFDAILELFGILFSISRVRKTINWQNIEKMIGFADEYDIEQLRVDVRCHLRRHIDSLKSRKEICVKYANFAWQVGDCLDVVNRCIPILCCMKFNNTDLPKSILAAVYEAKFNRLSNAHEIVCGRSSLCDGCPNEKSYITYWCSKCVLCRDCCKLQSKCNGFHSEDCRNYRNRKSCDIVQCYCGYTFDKDMLK